MSAHQLWPPHPATAGPEATRPLERSCAFGCPSASVTARSMSGSGRLCLNLPPLPLQNEWPLSATTKLFKTPPAISALCGRVQLGRGRSSPGWWSCWFGDPGFCCFPGNQNHRTPAGPSVSGRATPPGSAPARCPCQLFLGTHTQAVHVRACTHTHAHPCTHVHINQSSVSIISLTSRQSCLMEAVPIA